MKCYKCGRDAEIRQQKGRSICKKCFSGLIEKRVRKNARLNKRFSKGDRILAVGKLNRYFVKSICKNMHVNIFFRENFNESFIKKNRNIIHIIAESFIKKNRINKIVIQQTIDDEINLFLRWFFNSEKIKKDSKNVKLLNVITDDEAALFAKIRGIQFKANKKDEKIAELVNDIAKKHPNIKYNLMRNISLLMH